MNKVSIVSIDDLLMNKLIDVLMSKLTNELNN